MAEALISRGHEVHALMNEKCKFAHKVVDVGVTLHAYVPQSGCVVGEEDFARSQIQRILDSNAYGLVQVMKDHAHYNMEDAEAMLGDPKLFSDLKKINFDLCILDAIFVTPFYYIVPYKLDIPYVSFLAVFDPLDAGIPALPSFTPYINFGYLSDEMNFFERIYNTFLIAVSERAFNFFNPASRDELVQRFAPEKPYKSLRELRRNSNLWLIMTDVILDYPQVRLPHVIDIGGLNTKPAKPLPQDLQKIADEAVNGLIVVSFGSYVASLSEPQRLKLLNEFQQVKQTIIWRYDGPSVSDVAPNVHLRKWIPQNDLLGHPNTKIFITHCGANGQFEALYHGVPMLGLPMFGDQFYNSLRMVKKGMGIGLEFLNYEEGDIVSSIKEIMTNRSYGEMMERYSAMFKDRSKSPMETIIYWVEYIHKYGTKHLLSPSINYPWYTYWCIDLIVSYTVIITLIILVAYYVFKAIYNCIRRNICKRKQD